jgi:hypothetical protein
MKAITTLGMIAREILVELFRASVDVVSVANVGGMADTNYQGGNTK